MFSVSLESSMPLSVTMHLQALAVDTTLFYTQTQNTFHMAYMQHRYMTGESGVNPGMRPHENVSQMRSAISDWDDMREALQHAMDIHADMPESPERYAATINPSGSIRMSTLSPYRNW
ncbi:Type III effector protein AvrPto1 [Pseudomonas syringae pv. cerasicola]|uniref:Type III effector protein AvrPto1 n=4 Tax=Pseudomonas syringae TaxID=317 RepID=A0A0P9NS22_PSESX|nr:Type III effector protein AvrPto1 [Pseudomonas syringae pv. cerasicola]